MSIVTVVFGGPSAEHDISILTGLQAERVLTRAGRTVQAVYWGRDDSWYLVQASGEARDYLDGAPKGSKRVEIRLGAEKGDGFYLPGGLGGGKRLETGAILNCFHGGAGEGGGVQWLFELAGLRSTGATPFAAALGMDKLAFGATMLNAGLPSLPRQLLSAALPPSFAGPYIVKPRFGGSSIGIEVVEDHATALALLSTSPHLRAGAVVEPYRTDLTDFNVSVRTSPTVRASEIERPLRGDAAIFDYAAKYVHGDGLNATPREFPAVLPAAVEARIKELAPLVVEQTGLTGILRIDFLVNVEAGEVFVNEVNSIPGALSLYLWPDVPAAEVLTTALDEAERHVPVVTRNYEVGVALRAAGGISGKLAGLQ